MTSDADAPARRKRDGHVRVLPIQVANKIAAGEVVERPASVVKELVENALDAGARRIDVTITQGGRKLVSVRDDGCGMSRDDALLSLERQATSKIRDVDDIEAIDTLGFRGEAVPSIASVSRFTVTTRTADSDEGTCLQVNAGVLASVSAAGCPKGTLVEVRDLFCNVPVRRKFLRAYETETNHVRQVFTTHALAHPGVGFSLTVDGHRACQLAPATTVRDRVRDLFGDEFLDKTVAVGAAGPDAPRPAGASRVLVSGLLERPDLASPTRREQFVFVNGRPATAPAIAIALREAFPRRAGDARPAAVLFVDLPPEQVDVNVHPTKREVRFRNNAEVKQAVAAAVARALARPTGEGGVGEEAAKGDDCETPCGRIGDAPLPAPFAAASPAPFAPPPVVRLPTAIPTYAPASTPQPVQNEIVFALEAESERAKPWRWFRCLAQAESGYLLVETDAGLVTVNPQAARERIAYERLLDAAAGKGGAAVSQTLLIPETVRLGPVDAARLKEALDVVTRMGFQVEPFGPDTFKVDAVPQLAGSLDVAGVLATIAHDLAEGGTRRAGERWRDERIAKSIARAYAGASRTLTPDGAKALVESLCACRMPYVCPRGKPVMIFTSTRELDRKFGRL